MLMMRTRVRSSSEACVCSLVAPHIGEFLINSFLSWNRRFSNFFSRWYRVHRILYIVPQRQYHHHHSQERSTQLLPRLSPLAHSVLLGYTHTCAFDSQPGFLFPCSLTLVLVHALAWLPTHITSSPRLAPSQPTVPRHPSPSIAPSFQR
jgi:hypothetical protein